MDGKFLVPKAKEILYPCRCENDCSLWIYDTRDLQSSCPELSTNMGCTWRTWINGMRNSGGWWINDGNYSRVSLPSPLNIFFQFTRKAFSNSIIHLLVVHIYVWPNLPPPTSSTRGWPSGETLFPPPLPPETARHAGMVAAGPHPPRLCPISARGGGLARGAGRAAARLGVMSRASPAAVSGPPRLDPTPPRPDLTAGGDGAAEASGSRQGRAIERRRPAWVCRRGATGEARRMQLVVETGVCWRKEAGTLAVEVGTARGGVVGDNGSQYGARRRGWWW